jgi:glycosyltransferase involved in cell wall biosynthesis
MGINARAERLLGIDADSLVYGTYFITEEFTYNLSRPMRSRFVRFFLSYVVFFWACVRFQRFHFYCDRGLLPPLRPWEFNRGELQILKRLGKQVFFWTYGADIRTRERTLALGEYNCCMDCPIEGKGCVCDEDRGRANMEQLHRHATAIFSMGDMIEYVPDGGKDLFFWPVDLNKDQGRRYSPHYPGAAGEGPVRIVHAPNHPHYKGTRFLMEAVEELREEGLPVELRLVRGMPNHEAIKVYRGADIIFDQCIIGFHGYTAIEGMAVGKPVLVFIRKPKEYLIHPEECPIVNTPPDRLKPVLRELISDRARLHELGVQGRRYVEKYYSLEAFAGRLSRAYSDLGV